MALVTQMFIENIYDYKIYIYDDKNQINDMDKKDKIINNKLSLNKSCTKDEFSVELQMLHHYGVKGQNGSKKANGVAGVCVAGCRVDCGRWSKGAATEMVSTVNIRSCQQSSFKGSYNEITWVPQVA